MIKRIIRKWINNHEDVSNHDVREQYISLSGYLGIFCNVLLFAVKLALGLFINSIAVITDAFNNMTDISSSVISIISAKISNKPPDGNHPHGHGRVEYIGSLVVAALIFLVGFQLLQKSFQRLMNPEVVQYHLVIVVILILSILVKLWMFSYNRYIARTINSSINKAAAYDSISDVAATSLVVVSMILGQYTAFPVDGAMGLLISLLIMYSGFDAAKDTATSLLGKAPEDHVVDAIYDIVDGSALVLKAHDLEVHEYGPGRVVASIHAEMPDTTHIVDAHTVIDQLEKEVKSQMGIELTVHIDPVSIDTAKTEAAKDQVLACLNEAVTGVKVKVIRVAQGEKKTMVTVEVTMAEPADEDKIAAIKQILHDRIESECNDYQLVINEVQ
ncbi:MULTISPECIES: cation diffusion facilitator family transporter [Anoxynatronum]|uniref:Cation diffusion facilitator family transporter n=2 Tax=Anoxynatronum TaxID=210622 RepID=A0AA45WYF9_9CLOT|nr:cation diffusion facilitator family transporter [Anoxynatronum buryatiense]SMP68464.1 cation diffusion facilitator family transporter [Anoxynatronum buryatiense]